MVKSVDNIVFVVYNRGINNKRKDKIILENNLLKDNSIYQEEEPFESQNPL